jgi:hypothetical protein
MFKNRLILIAAVLLILFVSLAVSRPFSNAPKSTDLSGQRQPVAIPVTGAEQLSDYYQRHSERDASAKITADTSDYFARHPALRRGSAESVNPISQGAPIDECFDVSISELAACRAASQSASE